MARPPGGWRADLSSRTIAGGLVVAAAYVAMAWLGRAIGSIGSLTVWYPPAGLAMAGGVLFGWWALPFAALGELVASVAVFDVDEAFSPVQLVVNAVGYGSIWGAAGVLLRSITKVDLRQLTRDVLFALFVAIVAAPLLAALWGVTMQHWAGIAERPFWEAVWLWWMGDAVGATSLAPSLFVLAFSLEARRRHVVYAAFPIGRSWITLAHLVSPMVVAAAVFLPEQELVRFAYLIVVPVVLVAVFHGVEGAALSTLGLTPVVTMLLTRAEEAAIDRAALQTLLLVTISTGLVVGAITSDRWRIGRMHRELGTVIEQSPDLVMIVDEGGRITYLNPAARAAAGLGPSDPIHDLSDSELLGGGLLGHMAAEARAAAFRDGAWQGEVLLRTADGRQIRGSAVVVVHADGAPGRTGKRAATVVRDISELRQLEERLAREALYDRFTGLPNHNLFREHVAQAMKRTPHVAVVLATADRLRIITEGAGHGAAEQAVLALARNLVRTAGPKAVVARLSTDTFAVLVETSGEPAAPLRLGDRIVEAARSTRTGEGLPVSVAVGVAVDDGSCQDADELIRFAQVATGRAAEQGGTSAVVYTAELSEAAQRQLRIERELREGLDPDRWWLDYQPIVDLLTGRVVAVEALLRWRDQDGAPVPPYELILLAEQTGTIVSFGEAILERACREACEWAEAGLTLEVLVNVSGRQLAAPDFVGTVRAVLERTGIDPRRLSLEVTETAFAGDLTPIQTRLHELIGLGVDVVMDDFGTGYSSLAQMSHLPISAVKLDGAFIRHLDTKRGRELVRGVITLAHALSLTVVAEWVEDHAQLEVLRSLGCDRAQGFLLSKPLPERALVEVLRQRSVLV